MASVNNTKCGLSWCGYPQFLQRFANTKSFILVYGFLGTIQSMGYVYFAITLQTMEKRFKIPSQTTGLILSGNEVSQILLSVLLAYFGGQRNRPRFIAWGVVFCALSCFILALPHFIYGAGDDALRLTKEFMDSSNSSLLDNSAVDMLFRKNNRLCMKEHQVQECGDELESIVPLVLIFLSQFVLGIGNTLYYALGQTYLDDNTKKTNTPLLLSYAFALRTLGPAIGFFLGYASLKMYIDPTKTPLIDSYDPRWMGAWWFGWVFLGIAMLGVAVLIGLFPKDLPKKIKAINRPNSDNVPKVMKTNRDVFSEEAVPLKSDSSTDPYGSAIEVPTLKQFPAAMMRLFKNKLLMCNITSAIFYILGASSYFTFMSKYLEVQFHKSAADATIITGPFTIFGVVIGFLASGYIISKKKPAPSKLLMWNVIVGIIYMCGQLSNLYFTCPDGQTPMEIKNGKINLTSSCNLDCHCSGFAYSPVCREETGDTFFSPCVASCNAYSKTDKFYHECECARNFPPTIDATRTFSSTLELSITTSMLQKLTTQKTFSPISTPAETTLTLASTFQEAINATFETATDSSTKVFIKQVVKADVIEDVQPDKEETSTVKVETQKPTTEDIVYEDDYDDYVTVEEDDDESPKEINERKRRSGDEPSVIWGKLIPGACVKGCAFGFYAFSIVSSIVNCLGSSGRIGNLLVNYRCVSKQDKSVTQGLILMLISLFALIPGPILFGRIIDSTCLVWTEQCSGRRGNCQLYDQRRFRYLINLTAFALTSIGVFFDVLVWKFGKNLDLYGEREEEMLQKKQKDFKNGRIQS